jgi:hypothetical protein
MCVGITILLFCNAYSVALDKFSSEELATIGHIWTERPGDIALTTEALMSLTNDTAQGLLESLQKVRDQRKISDRGGTHQNPPVSGLFTDPVAGSLRPSIPRRGRGFQAPVDAPAHAPGEALQTTASGSLREEHCVHK